MSEPIVFVIDDEVAFSEDGHPNKFVASHLDVSLRTVEARRASIFKKFGVSSIAGMVQTWSNAQPRR